MRTAAFIIGILIAIVAIAQAAIVAIIAGFDRDGGLTVADPQETVGGVLLVVLVALLGSGFVHRLPRLAFLIFGIGGGALFLIGLAAVEFRPLMGWGMVMLVPAFFSLLGHAELHRPRVASDAGIPRRSPRAGAVGRDCPACGSPNEAGNTFCVTCGARLDRTETAVPDKRQQNQPDEIQQSKRSEDEGSET